MATLYGQSRILSLVFTDLAGSAALKRAHGDHAGRDIIARHRALLRDIASQHAGRIVDWAGDGCFLTFDTSSAAVLFALKLQYAHANDVHLPGVRVGIHIGEVTESAVSGTDFGDADAATVRVEGIAVDVAARICALSGPGQALMTSAVRDAAQPRIASDALPLPVLWRNYGRYRLKGLDAAFEICEAGFDGVSKFKAPLNSDKAQRASRRTGPALTILASAVVAAAIAIAVYPFTPRLDAPTVPAPDAPIERVVVLPFEDRTGADSALALGLGEELSSEMGKVGSLFVLAHAAARDERTRAESLLEVARKLKAHAAVQGSVSRENDRLHVRVALVRTRDGQQLWSDSYQLEGGDLLSLQSRWALDVATALRATITPEERGRLVRVRPADSEAEEAYLNGLRHWAMRTRDGFIRAIAEYNRAIQLDPAYADGYGALATAWAMMADYAVQEPVSACTRAVEFAHKALELDDSLVEARMALGFCTYLIDRDYDASLREFELMEHVEPNNANAAYWHGMTLFRLGKFDEALLLCDEAMARNPTSSLYQSGRAAMLLAARRDREALDFTADAREAFDGDIAVLGMHAAALVRNGRLDEARALLDTRKDEVPPFAFWLMRYGAYRAMAGQPEFARDAIDTLRDQPGYQDPAAFAALHASLGEFDEAFDYIDQAVSAKSALLTSIVWDPAWDTLRDDPRYLQTLRELKLDDFARAEEARLSTNA